MSERYNDILDQYCDKSFVYSVLCSKTSSFYNRWKYALQLPLIITSTVLTYVNSNQDENMAEHMKIVNPVFNLMTAILLALNNMLKLESKANDFKNNGIKYQKLCHLIEQKLLENDINNDFMNSVITQYDNVSENCHEIPNHISKQVHNTYATKKHLPVVCNGVAKIDTKIISNAPNVAGDTNDVVRTPRVIPTKQFQSDLQV
jgi:hypothetical protein